MGRGTRGTPQLNSKVMPGVLLDYPRTFPVRCEPLIAMSDSLSKSDSCHPKSKSELKRAYEQLEKQITELTTELEQTQARLHQEIAERQQAQKSLKAQQEFIQTLVDVYPNTIFVGGSFGIVTDINALQLVESELQQAKEQLRAVLDAVPGCVVWISSEGRYLGVNQYTAKLFNLSPKDFVGQELGFLNVSPEFVEFVGQFFRNSASTDQRVIEAQVNGHRRYYLVVMQKCNQGTMAVSVSIDITERQQAQEALQAQKDFLQTVIDANPNAIYVKDQEGRYLLANQACADFFGITVGEVLGKTDTELHPSQVQAERFIAADQEVINTKQQKLMPENFCLTSTDEVRCYQTIKKPLLYPDGQVSQVLGVSTDITEFKQAGEQLRQSEAQLRLALDAAKMGCWDWNLQTGKITWSNNLERLYGIALNSFSGTYEAFMARVHPEDCDRLNQTIQRSIRLGQDYDTEFRLIWPNGQIFWTESIGEVIYDETGQPVRMAGIQLDITERKLAELKLQESLQEKEVLLQEIHHRVKNNLQVVTSLLDLQSLQIKDQQTLEVFRESQNRIKSMALVHETLYRSQDLARVNFGEYIRSLTKYLFRTYGVKPDELNLELEVEQVTLHIDTAITCGLIINELVSNALKHGFPENRRGSIRVAVYSEFEQHLTLIVSDTGVGLSQNFDFKSSKSLGMQLVCVLVNQLEGTVKLDGSVGTEFKISFSETRD